MSNVRPSGPGIRPLRSNQFRHVKMMDKDFSPIDAASLVAWFAWAEANATRLRRRLDDLGADWQDPAPKHVPWGPKSDPAVRRTGGPSTLPLAKAQTTARPGNRHRGRRNGR